MDKRYAVTIRRTEEFIETVVVTALDIDEAQDMALELVKKLATDRSTFKHLGTSDAVENITQ